MTKGSQQQGQQDRQDRSQPGATETGAGQRDTSMSQNEERGRNEEMGGDRGRNV